MRTPKVVKGEQEWTKAGGTVQRKEYQSGRVETYYISPTGKRLRSWAECERFMQGLSPRVRAPSKKHKPAEYNLVVSVGVHTSPTDANGEDSFADQKDAAIEFTPMVEDPPAVPSGEHSFAHQNQKDLAAESALIVDSPAGPSGENSSKGQKDATLCTPKVEYPDTFSGGQFPFTGFNSATEYIPNVEIHQPLVAAGEDSPTDHQNGTPPSGKRPLTGLKNHQHWVELGGRVEKTRRKDGRIRCLYVAASGKKFRTWKECERFLQGSSPEDTQSLKQSPLAEQPPAAVPDGEIPFTGYNNGTESTPGEAHDSTDPGVQNSFRGYEMPTECTPSETHQPTVPGGENRFVRDNNATGSNTEFTPSEEDPPVVLSGKDALTSHKKSQRWIELGVRVEKKKRKRGVGYRYAYVTASGRKFQTWKECEKFLQVSGIESSLGVVHTPHAGPTAGVPFTDYNNSTECSPGEAYQPTSPSREKPFTDYNNANERTSGAEHVPVFPSEKDNNSAERTLGGEHLPVFPSEKESLTSHEKTQRWIELGGRVEKKRRKDGKLRCLYVTASGKKFRTWKECEKFLLDSSNGCTPSVVQPPPAVPGRDDSSKGYENATGFSPSCEQQAAGPSGGVLFSGHKIVTECTPSEGHESAGTGRENLFTGRNEGTECTPSGEHPSAVPSARGSSRDYEKLGIRVERKTRPRGGYRYHYVTASGKKFQTLKQCERFLQGSSTGSKPSVTRPSVAATGGGGLFQSDNDAEAFASSKEQQVARPSSGVSFTGYYDVPEGTPKGEHILPSGKDGVSFTGYYNVPEGTPKEEHILPSGKDATDEENARRWVGFGGRVEKKTYKNGRVCWYFVASNGKKFRTWEECEKFLQGSLSESTPRVEHPPPATPGAEDSFPGNSTVTECPPSAKHQHSPSDGEDFLKTQGNPTECTTNEEHQPTPASGNDAFAGNENAQRWIQLGGTVERKIYKDGKVRSLYIAPNGKKFRSWKVCEKILEGSSSQYSPSLQLSPPAGPVGGYSFAGYDNASGCTQSELHPPVAASGNPTECTPSKEPPPAGPSGEGHGAAMECSPSDELPPAGPNEDDKNAQRWLKLGGSVEKKQRKGGRLVIVYVAPNGEKLRSWRECERFLQETSQPGGGDGKALESGNDASTPPSRTDAPVNSNGEASTPPPSRTDVPVSTNGEDSGKGPKGGQQWIALGGSVEKKIYSSGRVEFFYVTVGGKKLRSWKDCERWLQTSSSGGQTPVVTVGPSSV